jgi:hypothetical protein
MLTDQSGQLVEKQHAFELAERELVRTKKAAPVARGGFGE